MHFLMDGFSIDVGIIIGIVIGIIISVGGSWETDEERTFIEETRMIQDFKYARPLKPKGNFSLSSSHFYQLI